MKFLTTFLFYFFSFLLFSQNPVSFQLTEKDGLPDIEFYTILEDNKGFVWLAADKGLFRYNGKDFLNFTNVDKKGLSLFGIFEDDQNRIWCNNISSQFFYVQNNKLVTFIDLSFLIKTGELVDFIVKNNKLLIFTFTKFYSVDVLSKEVKLINENPNGFGKPFLFQDLIYLSLSNRFAIPTHNPAFSGHRIRVGTYKSDCLKQVLQKDSKHVWKS